MTAGGVRARLDGITERLATITPGPWTAVPHSLGLALYSDAPGEGLLLDCEDGAVPVIERDADARFIAAAPSDVGALAGAVEAVLALADEYRANCDPTSTQAQVAELFRAAIASHLDPKENPNG